MVEDRGRCNQASGTLRRATNMRIFAASAFVALVGLCSLPEACVAAPDDGTLRGKARAAMRKAATFFRDEASSHGGYVYYYSPDLTQRWGEGVASADQIWVQPPGTPTVGMAYLRAYEATGDRFYLDAARDAAHALVYGQLKSGGWTNCIDFDPRGRRVALYRNGKGRGRNYSSLDDGQTQSAIRFLACADKALDFGHPGIHECARIALDALLAAQFPNGAFPQVWTGPVKGEPGAERASYPEYDWRAEGRIKEYWHMYTLNDNVAGTVADALIDAYGVYKNDRCRQALRRLGDFLIAAQMPDPQPAWAQQYNYEMRPIWARKFEPPAIASSESQDVIETLMAISRFTSDRKYLVPIPRAVAFLRRSLLPDGQLARYYELQTNKPLYMRRRGDKYTLSYDDSDLPGHYGWKVESELGKLERRYRRLARGEHEPDHSRPAAALAEEVLHVIADLDESGRWISVAQGERLVGQPRFKPGSSYVASAVFCRNMKLLGDYVTSSEHATDGE